MTNAQNVCLEFFQKHKGWADYWLLWRNKIQPAATSCLTEQGILEEREIEVDGRLVRQWRLSPIT